MRRWDNADGACLGATLLAAAALRGYGLDSGLPRVVHADSFMYVGEATRMLAPGPYAPDTFFYPYVYMDVLAALYWLLDLGTTYARHLAARATSSTFSLLLIALVYVAVRRQVSTRAAIFAATLTALCPVLLTSARSETTDAALVFFMTAALLLAGTLPTRPSRWLALGVLAGLAAGTKYTGAFVLPFVALAGGVLAWRSGRWMPPVIAAASAVVCAAVVFALSSPWILEFFADFRDAFETLLLVQRGGQIGRVQGTAWDYFISGTPTWEQPWLSTSLLWNLGPLLFVAALAAWAWGITGSGGFRRRWEALFILLFLVAACGAGRLKAIRFVAPVLPLVYILVGCGADRLLSFLPRGATPALLVLLVAHPAAASLRYVSMAAGPLSNDLAHAWLAANIPRRTRVFVSPLFVDDLADLPLDFVGLGPAGFQQYRLPEGKGPSAERSPIYYPALVDRLRRDRVEYLVLNSWFEDAFSPVPENLRWFPRSVESYRAFRERLDQAATLAWQVDGITAGRLGPAISIYRLN
jgi:4-amino-4-deoxy-L-arabinose transferase-like glycosyltransferase